MGMIFLYKDKEGIVHRFYPTFTGESLKKLSEAMGEIYKMMGEVLDEVYEKEEREKREKKRKKWFEKAINKVWE